MVLNSTSLLRMIKNIIFFHCTKKKIFKYLVCCSSQISYAMNGGGIEKVPQKALAESESTLH